MKKFLLSMFLISLLSCFAYSQEINFMTYNLRYENTTDGDNVWPNRRDFIISQIDYFNVDIFGTQEGLATQLKWMDDQLKNYTFVGIGREENTGDKGTGEFCAIFFNTDKYKVIESNTFWLSENPAVPGKGWDAACNRICTYALFRDIKSKKQFYVFNTHLDHMGTVAREKSAELILSRIKSINTKNYPFVLMGDFNSSPEQAPIKKISAELNDSKLVCTTKPFGPEGTFNSFEVCKKPQDRIDFIFTGKNKVVVKKYAALANVWDVRYPSDHYPVLITAEFKK
jgi:endonuclease/exonuclease/phosphatase family metal-dependent hydrolase